MAPKHFVRWDEPGNRYSRAICGKLADRRREADPKHPTCPDCVRLKAEADSFELFDGVDFSEEDPSNA